MPTKKSAKSEKNTDDVPKKNKSSYMFFCSEERENIKKDNPNFSNKEIVVEMGARWKILKESDPVRLKKFEELAKEDKERFLREKGENDNSLKTEPKKKSKKVVIKEDNSDDESVKETVKKTKVNGYINFCKASRETVKTQNPSLSPREVTMELGKLWKGLTNEEKESWKNI